VIKNLQRGEGIHYKSRGDFYKDTDKLWGHMQFNAVLRDRYLVFDNDALPRKTKNKHIYSPDGSRSELTDEHGLEVIPKEDRRVKFRFETQMLALMHEVSRTQYNNLPAHFKQLVHYNNPYLSYFLLLLTFDDVNCLPKRHKQLYQTLMNFCH
jgi:hypothetical protein